MRLLRITVENLNSLYGEHVLDLRKDLGDAALFLVVGPTGAGKSTLLDAVCLALFGRTPRLRKPSSSSAGDPDDARRVLSHGAGSGRAEVEFSRSEPSGRARYRAVWSCRRAHGRAEGALQKAHRSLERWDAEAGAWRLLVSDDRAKFFQPEFDRVLDGMALDEFQRAILLAQGQFAAFLEADEAARASILERLTGTERFRRIGERASRKRSDAKRRLRELTIQLGEVRAASDGEREALLAARARLAAELERRTRLATLLLERSSWLDRWRGASGRDERARSRHTAARTASAAAEADLARLAEDRRCASAARLAADLATSSAAVEELRPRVTAGVEAAADAVTAQRLATEKQAAAQATRADADAALQEALPTLQAARDVQVQLTLAEGDQGRLAEEHARASERLVHANVALAEAEQAASAIAIDARMAAEDHQDLERYAALVDRIPLLVDRHARLERRRVVPAGSQAVDETLVGLAVDDLERRLDAIRWAVRIAEQRRDLADGDACPLCGSTEHSAPEAELSANERELRRQAGALEAALAQTVTAELAGAGVVAVDTPTGPDLHEALSRAAERVTALQAARTALVDVERRAERAEAKRQRAAHDARAATSAEAAARAARNELRKTLRRHRSALSDLLGTTSVTELDARLRGALAAADGALAEATAGASAAASARSAADAHYAAVAGQLRDADQAQTRASEALRFALAGLGLTREELAERVLSEPDREALARLERRLAAEQTASAAAAAEAADALVDLEQTRPDEVARGDEIRSWEAVRVVLPAAREAAAEVRSEHADACARLRADDDARARRQQLEVRLERTRADADLWQRLHDLIGVGDGEAFKRFAQVMNLTELIGQANTQLERLTDRYLLCPATDDEGRPQLTFAVADAWQGGQVRPITTLSGGEKFLVSLALALGLGHFRSVRMPIETLLLDEGFGTLDQESQAIAMAALDRLGSSGMQVGIITHVDALREKIPAQVLVEKLGDGRSRIRLVA